MSIDPLAEDYVYNSTYAFQENKMGMGRELEGLELLPHAWITADAAVNPNGIGAHINGFAEGLGDGIKGLWSAVTNPVETSKGLGNTALAGLAHVTSTSSASGLLNASALDSALGTNSSGAMQGMSNALSNGINNLISGDGQARGNVLGQITGAVVGAKGMNAVTKGVNTVIKGNKTTNVFRVYGGDAKANGYSWTTENPLNISNFRNAAGLPSGGLSGATNTAKFMIEGTVKNRNIITTRSALPLDGNTGGLPELIINPKNVKIKTTIKLDNPL